VPFDLRDLQGEALEWLLDLQVGEDVLRLAERPADAPTGSQGALEAYRAGLDFSGQVADSVDPFADTPSSRRVDLTVYLPEDLDPANLVERGFDFSAARGVLWLWSPTTGALESIVSGVVRDVEYGQTGEPLTFSLEEVQEDDSARFPPADARVTLTSWPNASDKALSERYPWVLGEPGGAGSYPAPGLLVDTVAEVLLVAGHPVAATSVWVINDEDASTASIAVTQARDGFGRLVSVVDLTGSGVTVDPEADYFVSWGSGGGGLEKEDGSLLVGAGDVLEWMLGFSSLRLDRGRTAAASVFLNTFRIDTVISTNPDSRFAPWDWIVDHLLPILPVTVRSSSDGFAPVVWRFDATADMAVAHLEVSPSPRASLRSAVSYSPRDSVANELTLHFAQDPRADSYRKRTVLTGDPITAETDPDASLNLYCVASRTRYRDPRGRPETVPMEESTEVVWADATAAAILAWWAQRYALQARLVGYTADLEVVGSLEPGDVVTVTHPELSWSDRVFLVEEVVRTTAGAVDIDLRAVEDLAQTRKITP